MDMFQPAIISIVPCLTFLKGIFERLVDRHGRAFIHFPQRNPDQQVGKTFRVVVECHLERPS